MKSFQATRQLVVSSSVSFRIRSRLCLYSSTWACVQSLNAPFLSKSAFCSLQSSISSLAISVMCSWIMWCPHRTNSFRQGNDCRYQGQSITFGDY